MAEIHNTEPYKSTTCEVKPHRGTPVRMLGQRVLVYPNAILWRNPDTMKHVHLGRSRPEALQALEGLLKVKPVRRSIPPEIKASDSPHDALLYRAYWRAYYYASSRAKQSGREIMSRGEFEALMKRAGGACELTRIPFSVARPAKGAKSVWSPSIDRIVSRGSYERANCRLVCVAVNLALNEFGKETLIRIAQALVNAGKPDPSLAATLPT